MKTKLITTFILILVLTACHHEEIKPDNEISNPLYGAWDVKSIRWISDEQTVEIEQAQPGVFIYHENHYSLSWSPKRTPRIPFVKLAEPTDEEFKSGFKSIVFNSGSYVIDGGQMTATAKVAKVPGFEGGQLFYRFERKEDQLILTLFDEIYPDGTKPDWSGKWQTEFTLTPANIK